MNTPTENWTSSTTKNHNPGSLAACLTESKSERSKAKNWRRLSLPRSQGNQWEVFVVNMTETREESPVVCWFLLSKNWWLSGITLGKNNIELGEKLGEFSEWYIGWLIDWLSDWLGSLIALKPYICVLKPHVIQIGTPHHSLSAHPTYDLCFLRHDAGPFSSLLRPVPRIPET